MDDDKSLADYGLTAAVAKAQQPAEVGLAFRGDDGAWDNAGKSRLQVPLSGRADHASCKIN